VAEAMARKLEVSKSDILDRDSDNMAVRLALAETHVIEETVKSLEEVCSNSGQVFEWRN
jgi:multiple RNA-binding domain-containing protein 1